MRWRPGPRGLASAAAALLLVAAGWFGHAAWQRLPGVKQGRLVRQGGYRYISPLLDVRLPEGVDIRHEPIPFKHLVEALLAEQTAAGAVKDVSVYFRDLTDGPWFGIHEDRRFQAASLMKIPVMVAWLKRAERDRAVLQRRFTFDARSYPGPPQATPPAQTLSDGGSYPVEALLDLMLRCSDNRSAWLLFQDLRPVELDDVLDSMDANSEVRAAGNLVSAHGYSGFLRILYNAAFLGKEMSERALELLTHQEFPDGIVAGVPRGVVVASKFGEGSGPDGFELHEFGIVYHRGGPYILGVMTRGRDPARQAEVIRRVSALVYRQVEASSVAASPR